MAVGIRVHNLKEILQALRTFRTLLFNVDTLHTTADEGGYVGVQGEIVHHEAILERPDRVGQISAADATALLNMACYSAGVSGWTTIQEVIKDGNGIVFYLNPTYDRGTAMALDNFLGRTQLGFVVNRTIARMERRLKAVEATKHLKKEGSDAAEYVAQARQRLRERQAQAPRGGGVRFRNVNDLPRPDWDNLAPPPAEPPVREDA